MFASRFKYYWTLQYAFWFVFAVIPFLGITIWYSDYNWIHISHIFLQAFLGLLISHFLSFIYSKTWTLSVLRRIIFVGISAIFANGVWTFLRIMTFVWMTGETHVWQEFGGWYFGALYIFLCWAAIFYCVRLYTLLENAHRARLLEAAKAREALYLQLTAENVAREAQLKMLRYQLNPHFLFNVLNSIFALIKLGEPEKAGAMTHQLGRFLRYSLDFDPQVEVRLSQEVDALNEYLSIEKARFPDRLRVEYAIESAMLEAIVPGLILQPIVENAIKHAVATMEEPVKIVISAYRDGKYLCIKVSDNGPGVKDIQNKEIIGKGIGLKNTMQRLNTLYGDDASITFYSNKPSGLNVLMTLPFSSK